MAARRLCEDNNAHHYRRCNGSKALHCSHQRTTITTFPTVGNGYIRSCSSPRSCSSSERSATIHSCPCATQAHTHTHCTRPPLSSCRHPTIQRENSNSYIIEQLSCCAVVLIGTPYLNFSQF